MVSKASELFPEPLNPVITVRVLRGISTSMFFRLCCRAPCTVMRSSIGWEQNSSLALGGADLDARRLRASIYAAPDRELKEFRRAPATPPAGPGAAGRSLPVRGRLCALWRRHESDRPTGPAWMEEGPHLTRKGVDAREIRPLAEIAAVASKAPS